MLVACYTQFSTHHVEIIGARIEIPGIPLGDPLCATFLSVAILLGAFSGRIAVALNLSLEAVIAYRNHAVEWLRHPYWDGF